MIEPPPTLHDGLVRLTNGQLVLPGSPIVLAVSSEELAALVEALLLVAAESPTIDELATAARVAPQRIEQAVDVINGQEARGIIVQRHGDRLQLTTAPKFSVAVRSFLGIDREVRLSTASLETLAIVAYQQPVTRVEIESVRGVDCSGVLSTLHARGLIEGVARMETVGNPIQYGTTVDFLQHFGLTSLADLPPLGTINGLDGRSALEAAATPLESPTLPDPASAHARSNAI